ESYVRLYPVYNTIDLSLPAQPEIHHREQGNFLLADSNFFHFFSFHLIRGDASTALSGPDQVVLSASAAEKYFGKQDPIGRSLLYKGRLLLEVTGVCADPPSNSSLSFSFVAPLSLIAHLEDSLQLTYNPFGVGNFPTFLKLRDTAAIRSVAATANRLA